MRIIYYPEEKGYISEIEAGEKVYEAAPFGECEYIHDNADRDIIIKYADKEYEVSKGLNMVCVK